MGLRSEIVRRIGRSLAATCISAAGLTGCATFAGVSKDLRELTAVVTPNPATNVVCAWQNRLALLPDPTRNGSPTPGIAGQVFLHDAGSLPAEPTGELTIVVTDATPRPPGQAGPTAEVWHFSNATLKNLRIVDERFGRSYVVFLPWPSTWQDVTRVRFQARYDQPNQPTLYAQETLVTLDFTPSAGGVIPGTGGGGSIPNPTDILKQARAAQAAGRTLQASGMPPPVVSVAPATRGPTGQPAAATGTAPATNPPTAQWGPVTGGPFGPSTATSQNQPAVYASPTVRPAASNVPVNGGVQPASYPPNSGMMPITYPPNTNWVQPASYPPNSGITPITYPPNTNWVQPASYPPIGGTTPGSYPPNTGGVQPASYPPATVMPPGNYPPSAGLVQPATVPYRPPGTELAVQGPPEVRLFQ